MSALDSQYTPIADRVQILNEFCTKYSNAVAAYNQGALTGKELDRMEMHYHHKAVQALIKTGLDYEPAECLISDQVSCINPQTGEVIL